MTRRAGRPDARPGAGRALGLLILAALTVRPDVSRAEAPGAPAPVPSRAPAPVPTTRVLAIGSFTPDTTPADWQKVLPDEVRATMLLYLDGKIDQWFVKQDGTGVVFLMNTSDAGQAKALLEMLPFGPAGLMRFELIPLGPISPLRLLLTDQAR